MAAFGPSRRRSNDCFRAHGQHTHERVPDASAVAPRESRDDLGIRVRVRTRRAKNSSAGVLRVEPGPRTFSPCTAPEDRGQSRPPGTIAGPDGPVKIRHPRQKLWSPPLADLGSGDLAIVASGVCPVPQPGYARMLRKS